MSNRESGTFQKVSARIIVAAIIILAGILLLAFGYFGRNNIMTHIGLIVTLAGIMLELFFTIIDRQSEPIGKDRHL